MIPDARRLEELGLNSSVPPGQLLYDGWLIRLLRGKAKRARSVNAVYPSTVALGEKIAYCERVYREASLPAIFRITPFSNPGSLDAELGSRGYISFETTAVEAAPIDRARLNGADAEPLKLADWVEAVGRLRDSPDGHRSAHLARLQGMPLPMRAVAIRAEGEVVATGLTILEDDCAGLFDIITREDMRRRGHARAIVSSLLRAAWDEGARYSYLQVKEDNVSARRLYREFGFEEKYQYWYRGRAAEIRE